MARIALDHPRTLFLQVMEAYSRRRYGAVLTPGLALLPNRRVLWATVRHESRVARFDALDPTLKSLAVLSAAAEIGCSWCLDFGYWEARSAGVAPEKLRAITDGGPQAPVYDLLERQVIGYAMAMTRTPPEVTDAMVTDLRDALGDAALVELTAMVALENSRSRINSALGLTSQGFRESCERPASTGVGS